MKIAVIGAGVSGLVASYILSTKHHVTLFEAADYPGGHVNTIDVTEPDQTIAVDTGFIVYNEQTYPHFIRLLDQLNIATHATSMSFSVSDPRTNIEYASNLSGLFARKQNLLDWRFISMLREKFRFDKLAKQSLTQDPEALGQLTLNEFLTQHKFSQHFARLYILPMTAAVWSAPLSLAAEYPALALFSFLNNHGLLGIKDAPEWRVITGGSKRYVQALLASIQPNTTLHLQTPVTSIQRSDNHVNIHYTQHGEAKTQQFDQVILACHSTQALQLLQDPSPAEHAILGAIPYQYNEAVLHTDTALLPKRQQAWASWNYQLSNTANPHSTLTYNMNRLQGLDCATTYLVTLNQTQHIDPEKIIQRINYEHPVYVKETVAAQQRWREISGPSQRTHYCGAYWFNGFHEDGTRSAVRVCEDLQLSLNNTAARLHSTRTQAK